MWFHRLPSRALIALANSMQGLACWATSEAIKEDETVLLEEIDAQKRANAAAAAAANDDDDS